MLEAQKVEKVKKAETVKYSKLLMTYADGTDKFLMSLGYLMSILTGFGMPSFVFLMGGVTNSFAGNDVLSTMRVLAI
jgi:hypothetical protein